jgi:SAM-dependent methyltransferase
MHFDAGADAYASARPPYPVQLWEDVFATGLVRRGARLLDLGAGTGQATGVFLGAGMEVVAVEPGPHLARILRREHPRASVIESAAEQIDPGVAAFELVVAATSFHWMDADVVLPTVHRALVPTGRLLVWRNVFGDGTSPVTPFREQVHAIVDRRGTADARESEDADVTARRIVASGLFTVEPPRHYRWTIDLTTERVRALFGTFSNWTPEEVDRVSAAVDALGGTVTEHYSSWLIEASPRA